jgi:flagellar export protein FliJ
MAKFRYRLATLQRLRELERDELKSRLAEAIQAQAILDEQIQQLGAEIESLQQLRRTSLTGQSTNVSQLLSAQRYHQVLLGQQATMRQQAELLAAEVERRRAAVVEADRGVKVLEKLHDRRLGEFRTEQAAAEVKMLDEVAGRSRESREEVASWQA